MKHIIKLLSCCLAVTALVAAEPAKAQNQKPAGAEGTHTNKAFMDYFLPTPSVGSLTTNVWGTATVGPRDPKNGLEDATMKQWNYWDGQIVKAPDGVYHLFCSRWNQAGGHGAWYGSVAVHATSTNLYGPYADRGLCWPDWNGGSGHNVSALRLKDGRYAIVESGIRPGGVFVSDSLNGPWSYLGDVQAKFCTQCNLHIILRPDGRYQSIISDSTIGIADNVTGPYVAQGSIFKQTGVSPANMEDPCLWFSACTRSSRWGGTISRRPATRSPNACCARAPTSSRSRSI